MEERIKEHCGGLITHATIPSLFRLVELMPALSLLLIVLSLSV